MVILIPMAGAGKRFLDAGYEVHKPAIMTTSLKDGIKYPMVVCATKDLPDVKKDGENIIYVDRDFHKTDGIEKLIKKIYHNAKFITIDKLTEGQACTCLLAKDFINNDEELLIAGCDNGMIFDQCKFEQLKKESDVVVFTYRNDSRVIKSPNSYGWVEVKEGNIAKSVSVKKALSNNPMNDHAIVATFWFKKGKYYVESAEKMIMNKDRINNEYYVDQTIKYLLEMGLVVKVFEIDRYLGWGTPEDYENYEATINYWKEFVLEDDYLKKERNE